MSTFSLRGFPVLPVAILSLKCAKTWKFKFTRLKNINQTSQISQKEQFKFSSSFGQKSQYFSNQCISSQMFFFLSFTVKPFPLNWFKRQLSQTGFNTLKNLVFWVLMLPSAFRQKPEEFSYMVEAATGEAGAQVHHWLHCNFDWSFLHASPVYNKQIPKLLKLLPILKSSLNSLSLLLTHISMLLTAILYLII